MQIVCVPLPLGTAESGRVACPVGLQLQFEPEGPDRTVVRVAGPAAQRDAVDELMTSVMELLIDERGLDEELVEQPLELAVGEEFLPLEDGGLPRPAPPGGLSPAGGLSPGFSPLQLATMFGDRSQFRMGGPRVEWEYNAGRRSVWFAVRVTRLIGDGVA